MGSIRWHYSVSDKHYTIHNVFLQHHGQTTSNSAHDTDRKFYRIIGYISTFLISLQNTKLQFKQKQTYN